ncbi:transposase [Desulfonema ishimotonii]|uniref:Transposase n=1 Tax=Desulfonema ishimotonii TaxID=45657 RepID=A0A401G1L7_9BACT|nr:helix-turn-helix domain-containing protein [Desulfonema ishimotonii]GBC63104.1 transposase [Desulfonema ishimotonii]
MKYVRELTEAELETLEFIRSSYPGARVRNRAHAIILSHKRYALQDIADICNMTRQTASSTINKWEKAGIGGLYDAPRSGRPKALSAEDEAFIFEMAEASPRAVLRLRRAIENQTGKKISDSTLRRTLKKMPEKTDRKIGQKKTE